MEVQDMDGKFHAGAQAVPGRPHRDGMPYAEAEAIPGRPQGSPLPYTECLNHVSVYGRGNHERDKSALYCGRPVPLRLDAPTFRTLLELQGPSLGLWRAAEIAALREQVFEPPVLDLGCGDGLVTSMVLSKVEIGLDPDTKALNRAAQHGIYQRFEAVPAEEMQLPEGSIGTVFSNSVLEHLPHLDTVLAAVAGVLRPGGRLIFTCPTEAFSRWLVLPFARYADWRNHQLCHLNLWSTDCWMDHLYRVGLEVEHVRTYLGHLWVSLWDALELSQQLWIGQRRLFSMLWGRIPPSLLDRLALEAAQLNLAAPVPGGGRLIVARKL